MGHLSFLVSQLSVAALVWTRKDAIMSRRVEDFLYNGGREDFDRICPAFRYFIILSVINLFKKCCVINSH